MGLPGLDQPVMLHSSRMDMCKLTPEQCAYRGRKWVYWYVGNQICIGSISPYYVREVLTMATGIKMITISDMALYTSSSS